MAALATLASGSPTVIHLLTMECRQVTREWRATLASAKRWISARQRPAGSDGDETAQVSKPLVSLSTVRSRDRREQSDFLRDRRP